MEQSVRNPNEDIINPKNGWLSKENEETLQRLVRVIDFAEGFTLLFAQCNVPGEQLQLLAELRHRLLQRNIVATDVIFDKPIQNIREHIQKLAPQIVAQPVFRPGLQPQIPATESLLVAEPTPAYHAKQRDVIFVLGLAHSIDYKASAGRLLAELNLGRDAFRYQFPCAMLFWLPDYALTAVARQAPDFWAWRSGVFEFASQPELRDEALQHLAHGKGSTILEVSNAEVQEKLQRRLHLVNLLDEYERLPVTSATQSERAGLLEDIGLIELFLGEYRRALEYFEEALYLRRTLGNRHGEASTLNNIGIAYADLGENERALEYYKEALPLWLAVGHRRGVAQTVNNIGNTYANLGENLRALEYYEEALPLWRTIEDRDGEAWTLNNIGAVYSELGDKHRALEYYEQALQLLRSVGDVWVECVTRINMARIYELNADLASAEIELAWVVDTAEKLQHPNLTDAHTALEQIRRKRAEAAT